MLQTLVYAIADRRIHPLLGLSWLIADKLRRGSDVNICFRTILESLNAIPADETVVDSAIPEIYVQPTS